MEKSQQRDLLMIIEYSTRSSKTVVTEPGVEYPVDTIRYAQPNLQ